METTQYAYVEHMQMHMHMNFTNDETSTSTSTSKELLNRTSSTSKNMQASVRCGRKLGKENQAMGPRAWCR